MRPFQTHRARLLAGAAVAVLALGGAVFLLTRDGSEPAVAEAAEAAGAPEAPEGVVRLTAQQIEASGISIVAVGRGGGGEVRLSGRVEPMIDARAAVAAPVGGRVERVLVAPGQAVRAGQVLAVVVSGDAAVIRADADAASASADAARSAYQRDRRLAEQGVVARQDVETARTSATRNISSTSSRTPTSASASSAPRAPSAWRSARPSDGPSCCRTIARRPRAGGRFSYGLAVPVVASSSHRTRRGSSGSPLSRSQTTGVIASPLARSTRVRGASPGSTSHLWLQPCMARTMG